MRVDSIIRKLDNQIQNYFKSQGYDDLEIKDSGLFRITKDENRLKQYTDIYVYAEIDPQTFFDICNTWNEIITKYDKSAYFDIMSPGIYFTRIYWNEVDDANISSGLKSSDLLKFGESVALKLGDSYNDDFWVDEIKYDDIHQKLHIEISSTNYESKVSFKVYEDDIDTYDDLVKLYLDKAIRVLDSHMQEM